MPPESKSAHILAMPGNMQSHLAAVLSNERLIPLLSAALCEDLDEAGDITSKALIDPHTNAKGAIIAKQDGIIAGLRCCELTFKLLEETSAFEALVKDGEFVRAGTKLASIKASARCILAGERTALNFLGRLSGIATLTRRFVDETAHTKARICDTRKTIPGLRLIEKYAVLCGGGVNHRLGLHDAVLIKDNHIALAGGIKAAFEKTRFIKNAAFIEIEVDTLEQLEEALQAGAKRILLDNMNADQLRLAVDKTKGRAILEASGGVSLSNIKSIAETGVDLISCGALTHSALNFDVSLEIEV
jgi:nicotinate-nucleotide pyrophosphorylase (carboxylating)